MDGTPLIKQANKKLNNDKRKNKNIFLSRKRYGNEPKYNLILSANLQELLDIDLLHDNASLPSDVDLNYKNSKEEESSSNRIKNITKRIRKKKELKICHQCNKNNSQIRYEFHRCENLNCGKYFCSRCIKKYKSDFNTCYVCKDLCRCQNCMNDHVLNNIDDKHISKNNNINKKFKNEDNQTQSQKNNEQISENNILNQTNNIQKSKSNLKNDKFSTIVDDSDQNNEKILPNIEKSNLEYVFTPPQQINLINQINNSQNITKNNDDIYNDSISSTLEELKTQFFPLQYYTLYQKLIISYIFKHLENFIEQLSKNQILSEYVMTNMVNTIKSNVQFNEQNNYILNYLSYFFEQMNIFRNISSLGNKMTVCMYDHFEELKNNGLKIFKNIDPNILNKITKLNVPNVNEYFSMPSTQSQSPEMNNSNFLDVIKNFNSSLKNNTQINATNMDAIIFKLNNLNSQIQNFPQNLTQTSNPHFNFNINSNCDNLYNNNNNFPSQNYQNVNINNSCFQNNFESYNNNFIRQVNYLFKFTFKTYRVNIKWNLIL